MTTELMPEAVLTPGLWKVDSEYYHADRSCIGHSGLEVFRHSIPTYYCRYVSGTLPMPEPSPAMELGTLLHIFLLEPERLDSIAVAPECDRRTKEGRRLWEEFQAGSIGKLVVSREQSEAATRMAKAVLGHRSAMEMFRVRGHREQGVRWVDPATGLWCKCRPDLLLGNGICADIKTTSDPSPLAWPRQAVNLGYHRQSAFYLDGLGRGLDWRGRFVHVVVGSSEPHEVVCYVFDDAALELGARQNAHDLATLASCQETDTWLAPWHSEIKVQSLPKYAFYEE